MCSSESGPRIRRAPETNKLIVSGLSASESVFGVGEARDEMVSMSLPRIAAMCWPLFVVYMWT